MDGRALVTPPLDIMASSSSASLSASASASGAAAGGPQLWLVKLPTFVAEQFKRSGAGAASTTTPAVLAQLDVSAGRDQLTLRCPPTGDPTQPREFVVKPRGHRPMLVFTETPGAGADGPCKLVGAVSVIADATPVDSAEYRAFLRNRTVARAASGNTQRFQEASDMRATPQTIAELERKKRTVALVARPTKEKRARGEREEVESMLLRAFDQQQFYTFRQLEDLTNQPKSFLQEILAGMCVRESKGENKDKYQLNDKYRID